MALQVPFHHSLLLGCDVRCNWLLRTNTVLSPTLTHINTHGQLFTEWCTFVYCCSCTSSQRIAVLQHVYSNRDFSIFSIGVLSESSALCLLWWVVLYHTLIFFWLHSSRTSSLQRYLCRPCYWKWFYRWWHEFLSTANHSACRQFGPQEWAAQSCDGSLLSAWSFRRCAQFQCGQDYSQTRHIHWCR